MATPPLPPQGHVPLDGFVVAQAWLLGREMTEPRSFEMWKWPVGKAALCQGGAARDSGQRFRRLGMGSREPLVGAGWADASPFRPGEERLSAARPGHRGVAEQPPNLPPPLRRRLTVSEQVRGRAEGPRGQVPGQLLQLTQQTFHFNLQVLHRLLHRLLYDV